MEQRFWKICLAVLIVISSGVAVVPANASWFSSRSSDKTETPAVAPVVAPPPVGTAATGTAVPPPAPPTVAATGNPTLVKKGKDIYDELNADRNYSVFASAIKAAGLQPIFGGAGPFTVFAPDDKAFDKLPKGTLDNLLKPENKAQLARLLGYHMVAGNFSNAELEKQVKADNGQLYTVQAGIMTLKANGKALELTDNAGHSATIAAEELPAANGVIHPIDTVLIP